MWFNNRQQKENKMTVYTISLVRTISGTAYVKANSLEEAETKAEKGDWFDGFEDDSNNPFDDDWYFGSVLCDDEGNEY